MLRRFFNFGGCAIREVFGNGFPLWIPWLLGWLRARTYGEPFIGPGLAANFAFGILSFDTFAVVACFRGVLLVPRQGKPTSVDGPAMVVITLFHLLVFGECVTRQSQWTSTMEQLAAGGVAFLFTYAIGGVLLGYHRTILADVQKKDGEEGV